MPVLEMTDMNMRGSAIARVDGAVVFVPGAADGDVCDVEISEGGKNFLTGRVNSVVSPSPFRCEPGCEVYAQCGGCALRHINYEHELEVKVRSVEQAFRKNGMAVKVGSIRGTEPEGYRNKAVFHNAGGRLVYYSEGSRVPVYLASGGCTLLVREFEEIRLFCEEYFSYRGLEFSLGLRRGDGGAVALTVISAERDGYRDELRAFAGEVMERFGYIVSVHAAYGNPGAPGCRFVKISGDDSLAVTVGDVVFSITPAAFFQVNVEGASILCEEVRAMCDLRDGGRYADLYCGAGMFALTLAKACPGAKVAGIEINPAAIRSAKANAVANGIDGVRFFAGDAAAFPKELEGVNGVVVDPPRAGLSRKARELLMRYAPERIVYVSCNPETLARDCAALKDGYAVADVRCVDMFPRTGHVETVVCLTRRLDNELRERMN